MYEKKEEEPAEVKKTVKIKLPIAAATNPPAKKPRVNAKTKAEARKAEEEKKKEERRIYIPPPKADTNIDKLIDAIKIVTDYITRAKAEEIKLSESVHNADLEICDLMHETELNELDIKEKVEMFEKIREVRQRRRSYKVRQAYNLEIVTFCNMTGGLATKLTNLMNKLIEVKNKQDNAIYTPRIRTDIKESKNIQYPGKKK